MNKLALALGTFDGLHKGHLNVLSEAKKLEKDSFTPAAADFDCHPQSVLSGKSPPLLLSNSEKDRIFKENGILPVHIHFEDIKDYSPEEFVLFTKKLGAGALICGENFRFGKKSSGNAEILFELCQKYGIIFRKAKSEFFDGSLISSTRIRNLIQDGEIEKANEMLGRCFSYDFPVRHGKGKGKTWGFPTANQKIPDEFVFLKNGVYASRVFISGRYFPAVTDFGIRPTVNDSCGKVCETLIIDFNGDLYGEKIKVEFLKFLRDEQKFGSIDELSRQIKKDSKQAVEFFGCSK